DVRALIALALALSSSPALARCPTTDKARWVKLDPGATLDVARIERELRINLAESGIELCRETDSSNQLSTLRIGAGGADRITLTVEDRVTSKRIERVVRLSRTSEETRPIEIALAADELLRASWAEIVLRDAPRGEVEAPPEVVHAVARTSQRRSRDH